LYFIAVITTVVGYQDHEPVHKTAILGQTVQFDCQAHFPDDIVVPYVVTWSKKGVDLPIFIWYDDYPTHCSPEFKHKPTNSCRASRVKSGYKGLGLASLNLTNIQESDRGWYNCKVVFLNRQPEDIPSINNGTWYHLSVHAAPHFRVRPEKIRYVSLGGYTVLTCEAEGTPTPEIIWTKGDNPVKISRNMVVINDGTELRMDNIRTSDLGA
jgi:hypothetical protein